MKWNSGKIEMRSINTLEDYLTRNDYLVPYISINDKTPSWDGEIYVYKSNIENKDNLYGKVPIQVKGVKNDNLNNTEISYPFDVSDLKNYKDEGVMLFVVYMKNYNESKIYYSSLQPFDLYRIIKTIKTDQQKKSIRLKEFPKKNQKSVVAICNNFISNKKISGGIVDNRILSLNDMKNLGLSTDNLCFNCSKNFQKVIKDSSEYGTYLYKKSEGLNVYTPIDKIEIQQIINKVSSNVMADGEVFYEDYDVITKSNEYIIVIGNRFQFNISTGKIHYDIKGTLTQRIQGIKFFIELLSNNKIQISGVELPNVIPKSCSENIEDIKKELNRLETIRSVLVDKLGINEDLEMDNLSEEDNCKIICLIKSFVRNESVYMDIETTNIYNNKKSIDAGIIMGNLNIGNLSVKLLFAVEGNDKYKLMNFFGSDTRRLNLIDNDNQVHTVSLYTQLKKEDFLITSNINYKNIIDSYIKMPKAETQNNLYNELVLEILRAYDEQEEKNIKLLEVATEITELLLKEHKESESLFLKLNKFQIIKRERKFNSNEIEDLYKIKFNTKDSVNLMAINILLDNFQEVNDYFNKLSKKEKDQFNKYPISNLWDKNCNNTI
ncbi:DUF4365 domain-containing protein [Clostridium botulinum]|uniref:DUF4365 domain-containing protein n=1 Tax=Clostridium botulinum TaxID=1491 RepID=UPI0004D7478A|nr:DUF4365 domain-containing protein [Clostridium botulinum]KEH99725.1 putative phage protein [Clostridium botulinum C/D str. BKT75002]KEI05203.1 hypothetical protein Z954_0049 [Clostridium botulinum C/D str. BKT2873]QPW62096.1 DUF4365 domain-containing protein [Clostridium botulinum]